MLRSLPHPQVWRIDGRIFDVIPSLTSVIIMPLIVDITVDRDVEIYQGFTVALDGILPDWTVCPVVAVLSTF